MITTEIKHSYSYSLSIFTVELYVDCGRNTTDNDGYPPGKEVKLQHGVRWEGRHTTFHNRSLPHATTYLLIDIP